MPTFRPGFAHPFDELRDELDRLWTTLTTAPPLHGWGVRPRSGEFPAVNVAESPECITVEAEVPGLDVADVDVSVAGDELIDRAGTHPPHRTGDQPRIVLSHSDPVPQEDGRHAPGEVARKMSLPTGEDRSRPAASLVEHLVERCLPRDRDPDELRRERQRCEGRDGEPCPPTAGFRDDH